MLRAKWNGCNSRSKEVDLLMLKLDHSCLLGFGMLPEAFSYNAVDYDVDRRVKDHQEVRAANKA